MGATFVRYVVALAVIGVLAYNSVYIKKLDVKSEVAGQQVFDPVTYAATYLDTRLPRLFSKAPDCSTVLDALKNDPSTAFSQFSQSPTGGETAYFLVKGAGRLKEKSDESATLDINGHPVELATRYIFGNAVRDASGLVSASEFSNTMDLNAVSEEINKKLKAEVVPPFIKNAQAGDLIRFVACFELKKFTDKAAFRSKDIQLIPVQLNYNR